MARTRWPPGPVKPRPLTQARQIRPAAPVGALKRGPADRSFRRTARAGVSRIAGQAGPVPDPTPEPGQTLRSRAGSTIHTLPAEYARIDRMPSGEDVARRLFVTARSHVISFVSGGVGL